MIHEYSWSMFHPYFSRQMNRESHFPPMASSHGAIHEAPMWNESVPADSSLMLQRLGWGKQGILMIYSESTHLLFFLEDRDISRWSRQKQTSWYWDDLSNMFSIFPFFHLAICHSKTQSRCPQILTQDQHLGADWPPNKWSFCLRLKVHPVSRRSKPKFHMCNDISMYIMYKCIYIYICIVGKKLSKFS